MLQYLRPAARAHRLYAPCYIRRPFSRHAGVVNVQPVGFKNSGRIRRFTTKSVAYTLAISTSLYIICRPLANVAAELEDDLDDDTRPAEETTNTAEGDEDEEDVIFIPLGWPHRVPGKDYAGSDPEWQMFLKTARNPDLLKSLKGELVQEVMDVAARDKHIRSVTGTPFNASKVMLTTEFPPQAPPEYVRSGLEIGDDYIRWTTRPINPTQGDRIRKVLQPYSVGASFVVSAWVLWDQKVAKLKQFLGLDVPPEKGSHNQVADIPASRGHGGSKVMPEGAWGSEERSSSSLKGNVPEAERSAGFGPTPPSSALQPVDGVEAESLSDLALASGAFVYTLKKLQPTYQTPPRGVFFIAGLINLRGPSGFCNIYATALYDPANEEWTHISLELKELIPYMQAPRGGR